MKLINLINHRKKSNKITLLSSELIVHGSYMLKYRITCICIDEVLLRSFSLLFNDKYEYVYIITTKIDFTST